MNYKNEEMMKMSDFIKGATDPWRYTALIFTARIHRQSCRRHLKENLNHLQIDPKLVRGFTVKIGQQYFDNCLATRIKKVEQLILDASLD